MRVVVVGGTGNVGSAVLRALHVAPEVTSVVGVARRVPLHTKDEDADVEWIALDVGAPTSSPEAEDALVGRLEAVLSHADAVIHLAWLIQPSHERDALRRTNVDGTRRVLQACARARVDRVVVASSVGAYSPVDDDEPRDEASPVTGIPTSMYSVDKAAQERVLEAFAAAHPHISLAWLRPALIFQRRAGSEVGRYFFGRTVPPALLAPGRLPALPWPRGFRLQAVHADDVADAYVRAVLRRARGPFNVAAPDVLRGPDLAALLDGGRVVPVPAPVARAALAWGWQAHLVPVDPGWLDMAGGAPVLDTGRARRELGWRPRHTAAEAVREVFSGLAQGASSATPALRRRGEEVVPGEVDRERLGHYLADHLTGARAGESRFRRAARRHARTPVGPALGDLARSVGEEREALSVITQMLGFHPRGVRSMGARLAEHLARLKPDGAGRLGSRAALLLDLELLRAAVVAKAGAWQTLRRLAPPLGLDGDGFARLAEQADAQSARLAALHAEVEQSAFSGDAQVPEPDQGRLT